MKALSRTLSTVAAATLMATSFASWAAPVGFSVSGSGSGHNQNLSLTVNLAAATVDTGRSAQLYIAALLPSGALYAYTGGGWQAASVQNLPAYQSVTLGNHSISVLQAQDVAALKGATLYAGYGSDVNDMISKGTFGAVYTLGAPISGPGTVADYMVFSINVQDFSYPDKSAATIQRIVELHERYRVPVDLYLTDTILNLYQTQFPDLVSQITSSPYVSLNYHIRPPKPYYTGFDWAGLSGKSASEQQASVVNYETHLTDLTTGQPSSQSGGYAALKALAKTGPAIAAFQTDEALYDAVSSAFGSLGASWTISHTAPYINLGDKAKQLLLRPEHYDLKLFEQTSNNINTVIDSAFSTIHNTSGARAPYVLGVKMHDNDFFAQRSAWLTVFVDGSRKPNWDTTKKAALKSDADIAAQWTAYEAAVAYAASNINRIGSSNSVGLQQLVTAPPSPKLMIAGTMHIESNLSSWPDVDSLIAFFRRAVAAGKVGTQSTGMKWSVGADIGWLQGEPRAAEVISTLKSLGVEFDIHAHNGPDRIKCAEKIVSFGGTPTGVVSGVLYTELDSLRSEQVGSTGYRWQPVSLWGMVTDTGHTTTSDDTSAGLWRPRSSADWKAHDPAANLIMVGGAGRTLSSVETLTGQIKSASHFAPLYSASINVAPKSLQVVNTTDGIDAIESWAARIGALSNTQWATLDQIAREWSAAGNLPSRINP